VSADIIGNPNSGIVDAPSTRVVMNRAVKVLVWYDNELGIRGACLIWRLIWIKKVESVCTEKQL